MNPTNINDPAAVKALLDKLRDSQAWQEVAVPLTQENTPFSADVDTRPAPNTVLPPSASVSTSVASLLSQLHSSPSWPTPSTSRRDVGREIASSPSLTVAPSLSPQKKDTRSYTFQQALPHIARLADDSEFVIAIRKMKDEQDAVERQLWEDRRAIHKKYEEKVKIATNKANMISDGKISKHEADMLQAAFKKDLDKFDRERVLLAWDGLISKQQAILAQHDVPTMFMTNDGADRERQQRVMQVLEGII